MKSVFPTIRVSELVASGEAELKTGPFGTQLKANEYVEHGTPVINVRNIGFGTIKRTNWNTFRPKLETAFPLMFSAVMTLFSDEREQ